MDRRHLGGVPVAWQAPQWPGSRSSALGLALSVARKRFCRARPRARTTGSPLVLPSARAGAQRAFTLAKGPAKGPPAGPEIFFKFFPKPPCALSADVVNLRQFKGQNRLTMGL